MLAGTFASKICCLPLSQVQSHGLCVMDFMDILLDESNGNTSDDDTSSYSNSMEALQ
jgi:hypothetical protein